MGINPIFIPMFSLYETQLLTSQTPFRKVNIAVCLKYIYTRSLHDYIYIPVVQTVKHGRKC